MKTLTSLLLTASTLLANTAAAPSPSTIYTLKISAQGSKLDGSAVVVKDESSANTFPNPLGSFSTGNPATPTISQLRLFRRKTTSTRSRAQSAKSMLSSMVTPLLLSSSKPLLVVILLLLPARRLLGLAFLYSMITARYTSKAQRIRRMPTGNSTGPGHGVLATEAR
jgi:hypothetical protein